MKEISITRGLKAIVDDDMYDQLLQHYWIAHKANGIIYPRARVGTGLVGMHDLILPSRDGFVIDYINGDGLDNRRENLRHIPCHQYLEINKSKRREYKRTHTSKWRAKNWEKSSKYQKSYRKKNPDKIKAHILAKKALKNGEIIRKPCEVCGVSNVHGHHQDYAKPLDVRWLCPLHHKQLHVGLISL